MFKREEHVDKPDVLRGEHLQPDEDVITFGFLYDHSKLYTVPRMAVILHEGRATGNASNTERCRRYSQFPLSTGRQCR